MESSIRSNKGSGRIMDNFDKMYRRKAFVHWYKGCGLEESEFEAARSNLQDLLDEYQQMEDFTLDNGGKSMENEKIAE